MRQGASGAEAATDRIRRVETAHLILIGGERDV